MKRKLTNKEISILEERGCTAENWSEIHVDDGFMADHPHIEQVVETGHGKLVGDLRAQIVDDEQVAVQEAVEIVGSKSAEHQHFLGERLVLPGQAGVFVLRLFVQLFSCHRP